jgi:hypothetical protein
MEPQDVACTTCTNNQTLMMAYRYHKTRSPYWYVHQGDSERKKHNNSAGLRIDDPEGHSTRESPDRAR